MCLFCNQAPASLPQEYKLEEARDLLTKNMENAEKNLDTVNK